MADESEEIVEGEEPKKGGGMKIIIIIVAALLVLGGGGAFAWFKFIAPAIGAGDKPAEEEEKVETEEPTTGELELGSMYPMAPFILNLAGEGGKRFLKLTMELELSDPKLNAEIKANLPKIKDSILILLSSKSFNDIYTVEGKFKLRDEITARINRFIVTGHIRSVYFTEFVIQ